MATTTLQINSNRFRIDAYLYGSSAAVPMDANVAEDYVLPAGFGSILIESIGVIVGALSGAYVAVAPATEGAELFVVSQDTTTRVDIIGSVRFVNTGTASARPQLTASIDLQNKVLVRLGERIRLQAPIMAGAGVTGTFTLTLRGERFQTA